MIGFDYDAFRVAVVAVITARDLSDREAARQAGVSPSTITRTVRQGNSPDVDTLAALADWAALPLDAFLTRRCPIPETAFVADTRRIVAARQSAEAAAHTLALLLTASTTPEGTTQP